MDTIYWAEVLGQAFTANEEYACLKKKYFENVYYYQSPPPSLLFVVEG